MADPERHTKLRIGNEKSAFYEQVLLVKSLLRIFWHNSAGGA